MTAILGYFGTLWNEMGAFQQFLLMVDITMFLLIPKALTDARNAPRRLDTRHRMVYLRTAKTIRAGGLFFGTWAFLLALTNLHTKWPRLRIFDFKVVCYHDYLYYWEQISEVILGDVIWGLLTICIAMSQYLLCLRLLGPKGPPILEPESDPQSEPPSDEEDSPC